MTKSEKAQIRRALTEILRDDGDFHGGVSEIAQLVGYNYPPGAILKNAKPVSVQEVAARINNTQFNCIKE